MDFNTGYQRRGSRLDPALDSVYTGSRRNSEIPMNLSSRRNTIHSPPEPLIDPRHKMMREVEERLQEEYIAKMEDPVVCELLPISIKTMAIFLVLLNLALTILSIATSFYCEPWTRITDSIQLIVILVALYGILRKDSSFLKLVISFIWTFIGVTVLSCVKGAVYSEKVRNFYWNEIFFDNRTIEFDNSTFHSHVHEHEHYVDEPENYHDCDGFSLGVVAEELASLRSVFVIFSLLIGLGLKKIGVYAMVGVVGLELYLAFVLDRYCEWIEFVAETIIARRNSRFSVFSLR